MRCEDDMSVPLGVNRLHRTWPVLLPGSRRRVAAASRRSVLPFFPAISRMITSFIMRENRGTKQVHDRF
jgi:hypothetical protein